MTGEPLEEEKSSEIDNDVQEDCRSEERRYPEREDKSSFLTWCSIWQCVIL
jgi:hypothetical protein